MERPGRCPSAVRSGALLSADFSQRDSLCIPSEQHDGSPPSPRNFPVRRTNFGSSKVWNATLSWFLLHFRTAKPEAVHELKGLLTLETLKVSVTEFLEQLRLGDKWIILPIIFKLTVTYVRKKRSSLEILKEGDETLQEVPASFSWCNGDSLLSKGRCVLLWRHRVGALKHNVDHVTPSGGTVQNAVSSSTLFPGTNVRFPSGLLSLIHCTSSELGIVPGAQWGLGKPWRVRNWVLLPPLSEAGRTQTVTPSEFDFMTALWWRSEEWDMLAPAGVGKGDEKQGKSFGKH
ncbi:hypothetical protein MG293_014272 [Ovis ammon polii]|uniref:Uncharacterized protein n=1 Tax=Ovis ammon polii TaxID=230172 RepID=A0AAD4Y359_OVIAM|nr:hypothetical protein MG293_014272 [Ovis ammon polii]